MEVQHLPQPPESESATTAQCSHGDSLGAPPAASAAKPSGSCSTAQTAGEVEEGTPPGAASEPQGPALLPLGDGDEFPDECLVVVCRFLTLRELGRLACAARRFTERTLTDPGPVAGQVDGPAKVLCSPIEEGARLQLAAAAAPITPRAVLFRRDQPLSPGCRRYGLPTMHSCFRGAIQKSLPSSARKSGGQETLVPR